MERDDAPGRPSGVPPLVLLDDRRVAAARPTPRPELIRVCLVCGAELQDRACKLVCRCGYFLSCSDYL